MHCIFIFCVLLLQFAQFASVLAILQTYNVFRGYGSLNASVIAKLNLSSEGACAFTCTAKQCSAVQYDTSGSCSILTCAAPTLSKDSTKCTYIPKGYVTLTGLPIPMFEWMLTDQCGLTNTGWLNTGLAMIPRIFGSGSLWTPQYNVSVGAFGNAILHQNIVSNTLVSSYSSFSLNMNKSLTLSAYIWLYSDATAFTIIEFSVESGAQMDYSSPVYGPLFWVYNGGLFYSFQNMDCSGDCYGMYLYSVPVKVWTHVALVYDASSQRFFIYLNRQVVSSSTTTTFSVSSITVNYVVTASRGSFGQLPGTTYCLKVFQAALNASSLAQIAKSCWTPTIRGI